MCKFSQGGDKKMATDWIFNIPDTSVSSDMDATTSSIKAIQDDTGLPDGGGSKSVDSVFNFVYIYILNICLLRCYIRSSVNDFIYLYLLR